MTKAKSTQPHQHQFLCDYTEQYCDDSWCCREHRCSVCHKTRREVSSESPQPQLPLLGVMEDDEDYARDYLATNPIACSAESLSVQAYIFNRTSELRCRERQLLAARAENESLKAKLQDAKELIADLRSELHAEGCDVNDLRSEVESLKAERDKLLTHNLEMQDAIASIVSTHRNDWSWEELVADVSALKAQRDKLLEVIREYREGNGEEPGHGYCSQ